MSKRKLTDQEVVEIRCLELTREHYSGLAKLYSHKNIAAKFGVSPTTIHGIVYGYSYQDVPWTPCEIKNERCGVDNDC